MAVNNLQVVGYRDYIDPKQKDSNWILKAVRDLYEYGGAENLLKGKAVQDIFDYAAGKHNMAKFNAMFPESKKRRKKTNREGPTEEQLANHTDLLMDRQTAISLGMDMQPLGILQQPLSSALSTLQKGIVYVGFNALDALSNTNRKLDMDRLRNRPGFEQAIAPAKEILGMPLQAPKTQFNTPTVDISTLQLDPTKEDQLNLWADLFYKLRPETAFEVAIQAIQDMTNFKDKIDLEKRDQIYFGVSSNRTYFSEITTLMDYDYEFPGNVWTPNSDLPDFSDQSHRYIKKNYNVEKMLNTIGQEHLDADFLQGIFEQHWKAKGYQDWKWNKAPESRKQEGIPVVYMEFKSFDVLRIDNHKTGNGRMRHEVVPFGSTYKNGKSRDEDGNYMQNKWPQQTYFAYWVPGTDHILKSGPITGLFRDKGKENKSKFTIQIFKSKEKSDVEQCMTAVDDAQRAYIKLQLSVIMAKPKGVYIDMKYLRASAEQMADELGMSAEELLVLFLVKNVMIGDTEDMDGQNEGSFLPFREIPGGLGAEVSEYLAIIQNAKRSIAELTGFNDALTGQSPNPDQLVGIQKLLLQSSLNSLHYAQKAIKRQVENLVLAWAPMIQYICQKKNKKTAARKALENIIGGYKIDIINDMDDLSVTQFGIKVEDAPDEQAQQELKQLLFSLLQGQRIDLSDYFLVKRVMNYKDAEQLLIMKEKQKAAENRQMQTENNQAIRDAAQTREQGAMQRSSMTLQAGLQEVGLKNQGMQTIEQMRVQLQLMLKQLDQQTELNKKNMQGQQMRDKLLQKHNLDNLRGVNL